MSTTQLILELLGAFTLLTVTYYVLLYAGMRVVTTIVPKFSDTSFGRRVLVDYVRAETRAAWAWGFLSGSACTLLIVSAYLVFSRR